MLQQKQEGRTRRMTVGSDTGYDTKDFVNTARELNVPPNVTKNDKGRRSNLDQRSAGQPGYAIGLSRGWLVEKGFGWVKQTGPLRMVKLLDRMIAAERAKGHDCNQFHTKNRAESCSRRVHPLKYIE